MKKSGWREKAEREKIEGPRQEIPNEAKKKEKKRDTQKPHADRRRVLGAKLAYVCICRSHSGQYLSPCILDVGNGEGRTVIIVVRLSISQPGKHEVLRRINRDTQSYRSSPVATRSPS
jgi:hypothetical protein